MLLVRRGNVLAVPRGHVTEGSYWLGRRQCRYDAGYKIGLRNLLELLISQTGDVYRV